MLLSRVFWSSACVLSPAHGGILNAKMTPDLIEALYCMRQRCSPNVCHGPDFRPRSGTRCVLLGEFEFTLSSVRPKDH